VKLALSFVPAMFVVLAACATDPVDPGDPAAPVRADLPEAPAAAAALPDGLTMSAQSATHIAGDYVDPTSHLGLHFDSTRDGDLFELHVATAAGVAIVDADTVAGTYRFSYLGGRLTLTVEQAWVEAVRAEGEEGPAGQDESALHWDGDMTVLDEMLTIPEVAAMPWMSRALGARGFTGASFPASLAIHKLARQSADALAVELPALETTATGSLYCSRPTANECYGMCGQGCSCWSWVCGDCCYHNGCARHDTWCRQGQWYYCYNITAVIALFGC
jgi:hypothetical protein